MNHKQPEIYGNSGFCHAMTNSGFETTTFATSIMGIYAATGNISHALACNGHTLVCYSHTLYNYAHATLLFAYTMNTVRHAMTRFTRAVICLGCALNNCNDKMVGFNRALNYYVNFSTFEIHSLI